MRAVLLDKVASVTLNCGLRRDARLGDIYPCNEGDVIAVRVLTSKANYNALELATGRMSTIKQGDILAGALGHRNALQGYEGRVPAKLKTGDTINLLNLGGVLGECISYSPLVGAPHECEVIGAVLDFPTLGSRRGVPANIASKAPSLDTGLDLKGVPVIAVIGTCMNSGKTEACLTIVQQLVRRGMRVAGAKATGVSLRRDVLAMEDAGATKTLVFTDFGVVTTQRSNAPGLTRTMLNALATDKPDVLILELGDGLLGNYGVDAILNEADIRGAMTAVVLAATDPVGAWGGLELLKLRHSLTPTLITGPATDNGAGTEVIERETGIPCINARHNPAALANELMKTLEKTLVN